MKQTNPLRGLRVPSLDEVVQEVIDSFGIATMDLADPKTRERFRTHLTVSLSRTLDWRLRVVLERASEKAVRHVFALMRDPDYQEARTQRRLEATRRRREREAERAAERSIERLAREQKRKGLVQ